LTKLITVFLFALTFHTQAWSKDFLAEKGVFQLSDGVELQYRKWAVEKPQLLVVNVHGFNDYSKSFTTMAKALVKHRQAVVYAYDQRGFGANPNPGIWPSEDRLVHDLREIVTQLRANYPTLSLVVIGESMGGAVLIRASTEAPRLPADLIILKAPAIWGAEIMPWYQRISLEWFNAVASNFTFTGRGVQSLGIRPTDDPAVAEDLSQDPLVIKETRVSSLFGLTKLMSQALNHPIDFSAPTLVLYGNNDKIIPPKAMCYWLSRLSLASDEKINSLQFIIYTNGWHMLTRQLEATTVINDILAWLNSFQSIGTVSPILRVKEAQDLVCKSSP